MLFDNFIFYKKTNSLFPCQYYIMIIKGRFQILKGYQNNHVTIGFGSYGQVKLARDLQNGQIVAVKIINKIAKNEVMMHYGLSHPKIIKLLDVHIDTERQITYMILQYAECGTLFDKIKMEGISRSQIKQYFRDICEGVAYLHSKNIMHRDIKPQNILINKKNQAKLCDFGFAAILGERMTLCGTYEYMSPEMIQNKPYDYKIDIWALGILLFELIAGHAPFRGDRPEQVLEQMKTKILFSGRFQNQDINLIKTILRVTPHKRPYIQQIMSQPFFAVEDKIEQFANRSTTATFPEVMKKQAKNSLQSLNESCNPKKIGSIQKFLEEQQLKQAKKYVYPSFNIPKNAQKFGLGLTIASNEYKQSKGNSPQHANRLIFTKQPNNQNPLTFAKPMTQYSNVFPVNKGNSPTKNGFYSQGQIDNKQQNSPIYINDMKGNTGVRRFS